MSHATPDDIVLEQLLRAIEDDPLWFGYSCGCEHLLDGPGLPKTGEALRDFLSGHSRNYNILWWDTKKGYSAYDRLVIQRKSNWVKTWFVQTRYGRFLIFSERY